MRISEARSKPRSVEEIAERSYYLPSFTYLTNNNLGLWISCSWSVEPLRVMAITLRSKHAGPDESPRRSLVRR